MDRLRRGEDVDVRAEAPADRCGRHDRGARRGHAFSSVQRTAVEAAVGQAKLPQGRRPGLPEPGQAQPGLLHRQLTLLDTHGAPGEDPETLEDLFRLDHLTTRMRRHAEGLIILSGAAPGRQVARPGADLRRGARRVAEVEDYTRVTVMPVPQAPLLIGGRGHRRDPPGRRAGRERRHLLAAAHRGTRYAAGGGQRLRLEVEDRGLGLSQEQPRRAQRQLANPPEFDLADSDRLGLFVVASSPPGTVSRSSCGPRRSAAPRRSCSSPVR